MVRVSDSPPDDVLGPFEAERDRLWRLSYRMLGIADDADEIVQDAWLRWQTVDRTTINNPAAWLTTVTSRLALDRLRSARRQRESYVGPWLPEPIETALLFDSGAEPDGFGIDPAEATVLAESVSMGFLAVMERLGPVERAVFLLHDVFRLPFDEVAGVVERSPEATRQIAVRARARIEAERPRFDPDPAQVEELVQAFLVATVSGDQSQLSELLVDDVVLVSDGGANVRAARHPIVGVDRVSRFLTGVARQASDNHAVHPVSVNGHFSVYITDNGRPDSVLIMNWAEQESDEPGAVRHRVSRVYVVRNPDKLARFAAHWKSTNQP